MSGVGPVSFSDPTARRQLIEEGSVVTFRSSERTVGETWARLERTAPKFADVEIEEIGRVDPEGIVIAMYRDESGFESMRVWLDAIHTLNGEIPEMGILYRVELQEITDPDEIPEEVDR